VKTGLSPEEIEQVLSEKEADILALVLIRLVVKEKADDFELEGFSETDHNFVFDVKIDGVKVQKIISRLWFSEECQRQKDKFRRLLSGEETEYHGN